MDLEIFLSSIIQIFPCYYMCLMVKLVTILMILQIKFKVKRLQIRTPRPLLNKLKNEILAILGFQEITNMLTFDSLLSNIQYSFHEGGIIVKSSSACSLGWGYYIHLLHLMSQFTCETLYKSLQYLPLN